MDAFTQSRNGILLAQQGRRTEALQYLRLATQQEPPHPEVWLWLAHVTPSLEEYRYCVQQAINLAPNHVVARQMESALRTIPAAAPPMMPPPATNGHHPSQPVVVDNALIHQMQRQKRRRIARQRISGIIGLILLLGLVGLVLLAINNDWLSPNEEESFTRPELRLTITVDTQDVPITFRMITPSTWLAADPTSDAWQTRRAELATNESINVNWGGFETNFNAIAINPADDSLATPLTIVETNEAAILASNGYPLRLQLVRFGAIYASMNDASCSGLEQLKQEQETTLSGGQISGDIIENQVVQQASGGCIYLVHYLGTSALSNQQEHVYVMYVPVGNTMLAEWHLTVVDVRHDQYRSDIEDLIDTLRAL